MGPEGGILEDHADLPFFRGQPAFALPHGLAMNMDASLMGVKQPGNRGKEGTLARARFPQQAGITANRLGKLDPGKDRAPIQIDFEIGNRQTILLRTSGIFRFRAHTAPLGDYT